MVGGHNIKYFQISVGVRVGMQQQTDGKVKIDAKATTTTKRFSSTAKGFENSANDYGILPTEI